MENEVVVIENSKGIVPVKQLNVLKFFSDREEIDAVLKEARELAFDFEADLETAKGRKKVASQAYLVTQSKTLFDGLGKDGLAILKSKIKPMDANRKYLRDEFDKLRDGVREPLNKWEDADKARKESERIAEEFARDWDDAHAEHELFLRQQEIERKEAELAKQEAERRAKEEAARFEQERKKREERIAREAEERAKREAEEAARAERERAEQEKREAEERERQAKIDAELAEKRRVEAEKQAERDRIAAEARAKAEKEAAIKAAEEKARQEADRKERERLRAAAEAEAERKRVAADKEHRKEVNNAALACFETNGIDPEIAKEVIRLIASGRIDFITMDY